MKIKAGNDERVWLFFRNIILIGGLLLILCPLWMVLINSFKTLEEAGKNFFALPSKLNLENYIELFTNSNYWIFLKNSFKITVISIILILIFVPSVSYSIARNFNRKYYKTIYFYLMPEGDMLFFWRRIRKLLEKEDSRVKMGISNVHGAKDSVLDAFREAVTAVKSRIYKGESLIFAKEIKQEDFSEYYLEKEIERELEQYLKEGNESKTGTTLDKLFKDIEKVLPIRIECMELLYSQIILIYRRTIRMENHDKELDNLSESFLKFDSVLEIESYLRRIAENICHMQPQRQSDELTNTGMDIVEKMSEYAVNNYNMDITIRNLAENVFFMNQSYISHLFAEKKGISFSAFLRMIRICHAKEFLADARWSVTDVALMSGYNDTSQFIRIFRQETGMTPKKYRIFLKNGGSENESRES